MDYLARNNRLDVLEEIRGGLTSGGLSSGSDGLTDAQLRATAVPVSGPFALPPHDSIILAYTAGNLTSATYKVGAATVATVTLGYDGSGNLTSVTKV